MGGLVRGRGAFGVPRASPLRVVILLTSLFALLYANSARGPLSYWRNPKSFFVDPGGVDDVLAKANAPPHPIDTLVKKASAQYATLLQQETKDYSTTVKAYIERRGRCPPPRFGEWFSYAEKHGSIIIESFFDQIYDDLQPFWAVPAREMQDAVAGWKALVSLRNGSITIRAPGPLEKAMGIAHTFSDMIKQIAHLLPDFDMPLNLMDESRLLVPWEQIEKYHKEAERTKPKRRGIMKPPISRYESLPPAIFDNTRYNHRLRSQGPLWDMFHKACPPNTTGRKKTSDEPIATHGPVEDIKSGTFQGFVSNWTIARDPCHKPYLRNLHGSFIEPVQILASQKLFPLFGGCKSSVNNEIILPAATYWSEDERFEGGKRHTHWKDKKNALIWRGAASGGRNRPDTWTRFHRHRFLSTLNGTTVSLAERHLFGNEFQHHNRLPPWLDILPLGGTTLPKLGAATSHEVGAWLRSFADVGFTDLECVYPAEDGRRDCPYVSHAYRLVDATPMSEQYHYKYLPDVDGHSYSGRWRAFLRSHSVPLKATIYREWHDARLVPWKHFVPLDMGFTDVWAVMEYFLGFRSPDPAARRAPHDAVAKHIAESGQQWAEKVLRKEDMLIYLYRVILEYARVIDPRREDMGITDCTLHV